MNSIRARNRKNFVYPTVEEWRPPLMSPRSARASRPLATVRRWFDLQAGSLWRDLSDILPSYKGDVLDIGCGAQPYRELFRGDVNYTGIDTAKAPEAFGYSIPDALYYEGDRWPVADHSMDLALATETLEHVEDVSGFLAEAARCLRPGGHLILTVPFAARWHFIPHDYWRFTPSGLVSILRPHGFSAKYIWARGNATTVACYKALALLLPLLFPPPGNPVWRVLKRLCGIVSLPLVFLLAIVGTASLSGVGGDDCLGYTVVAERESH